LLETASGNAAAWDGCTVTVTAWPAVPPGPLQVRLKVLLALNTPVEALPEVDAAPDQAPLALQLVAPVEDHESVLEPPLLTLVGVAVRLTAGAGCALTVTVVEAELVPPLPVHDSV
jgi:hypothetical protein